MKTTVAVLTFVSLAAVLSSTAEAKVKKPVVCFAFAEMTMTVDGAAQKVAVCQDGAKPVVLTTYQVMSVKDSEGTPVKAVVGYR